MEDYETRLRNLEEEFRKYREERDKSFKNYQLAVARAFERYHKEIEDLRGLVSRFGERVVKLESRKTSAEPPKVEGTERIQITGSQAKEPRDGEYFEGIDLIGET